MTRYEPQGIIEPPKFGVHRQPSRWARGGQFLDDERLHVLEVILDEAFRIPGTRVRFGLDGIIGLVPGLGDILAGILSLLIPLAAWVRGVPYITLIRMLLNVCVGLLVGTIPLFGDAFDIFWKTNRRNYGLLTRSITYPRRYTWKDWMFLLLLSVAVALIFTIPIILIIWLAVKLALWHPVG